MFLLPKTNVFFCLFQNVYSSAIELLVYSYRLHITLVLKKMCMLSDLLQQSCNKEMSDSSSEDSCVLSW